MLALCIKVEQLKENQILERSNSFLVWKINIPLKCWPHNHGIVAKSCIIYTANILTVLSTAFGSVTFSTALWLCRLQVKALIDLKLYSSMSLIVIGTVVGCDHHCQITVVNVTQPMTVNYANICSVIKI